MVAARQASCSRCLLASWKNGIVFAATSDPHLVHTIREGASQTTFALPPQLHFFSCGVVSIFRSGCHRISRPLLYNVQISAALPLLRMRSILSTPQSR
ncbi:hypothetical protein HJA76_15085 [Rhizobium bangladeshense]|uniref:hypothetical protein n=1 Tax=Rhizobium bangladeshense TaxID=1138189 RepID=UPI001C83DDA0|nr:hypothetical protein [Rhizobium bangladeshense]MBX4921015.1 hypothetical protein [Rhizobium bangladeshense]